MITYSIVRDGFDDAIIRVWPNDPGSANPTEVAIEMVVDGECHAVYMDRKSASELIRAVRDTIDAAHAMRRNEDA